MNSEPISPTFTRWNKLISLKSPSSKDILSLSPGWKYVRPEMKDFFYIGDNLSLCGSFDGIVTNPALTLFCNIAGNGTGPVPTQRLENGLILGISITESAAVFAESLHGRKAAKTSLATLSNMDGSVSAWEIYYKNCLTLAFMPLENSKSPERSLLRSISFSYGAAKNAKYVAGEFDLVGGY